MMPESCLLCGEIMQLAAPATLTESVSIAWQSIDLAGHRHRIVLALNGPRACGTAAWLARALPDHEFTTPHLLVADLAVTDIAATATGARVTLEALTFPEAISPGPTPG